MVALRRWSPPFVNRPSMGFRWVYLLCEDEATLPNSADGNPERKTEGDAEAKLARINRRTGEVSRTFGHVVNVGRNRYGWGSVPRFVAITYEGYDGRATAYFYDAGWLGWRPLLTGSNRRMAHAIKLYLGL
jgi:hypothetical protein